MLRALVAPMFSTGLRTVGAALLGACAVATPAGAFTPTIEQVDRGSGVTGGSSLNGSSVDARYITDDGRFALFDFRQASPFRNSQTAEERAKSGVYLRDTVSDTLRQLARGNTETSGVTADQRTISVITEEPLLAADANGATDLYLIDLATGAPTLAPTNGPVTGGAITADGRSIVWSSATGTARRALPAGPIERLSDLPMPTSPRGPGITLSSTPFLVNRTLMSRDGRVVVTARSAAVRIVTPGGNVNLEGWGGFVTPDGAMFVSTSASDGGGVMVRDLAAGTSRTFGSDTTLHGAQPMAFTADGTRLIYLNRLGYIRTMDLRTGALVTLAGPDYRLQRTDVFSSDLGFLLSGWYHAFVVPRTRALPEPADLPDAFALMRFEAGCRDNPNDFILGATRPTFALSSGGIRGATLTFTNAAGAVLGRYAVAPGKSVGASIGWTGGWTVDVAITLDDGRIVRGRWTQRPYTGTEVCPPLYF